jgi:hypothetical protein
MKRKDYFIERLRERERIGERSSPSVFPSTTD